VVAAGLGVDALSDGTPFGLNLSSGSFLDAGTSEMIGGAVQSNRKNVTILRQESRKHLTPCMTLSRRKFEITSGTTQINRNSIGIQKAEPTLE
jgi:hypothetical protein